MKFLAVDIGASSGRTIVGDLSGGKIALTETHRFDNGMVERDGGRYWDYAALLAQVRAGIAQSGSVAGIGIDTWGVDYGLIDAQGQLIGQPYAYRDGRGAAAMPAVYQLVSKARLYATCGLQEMPFNSIFQVMADHLQRPAVLASARRLLFMPDLLTYHLTGELHTEYTIASTSGLLDAKARTWSDELLRTLGFPRHLFGDVTLPGVRAGAYQGTPVYLTGGHDTASAVAAVPAVEGGDWAYLSSGTWSLLGAELDQPVLTEAALSANFTNEGGAGGKIRFLKNVNGLWLIQECRRKWAEAGQKLSFAEIAAAAAASTYKGTIAPNDARFMAPADMVAEITAALREQGQPLPQSVGDYARCCYLSLANAYRQELTKLSIVTGKHFRRLHIVGGGSQVTLLNQLTADACGIPVLAGPVEATALGNLCLQALSNGCFSDLAGIRAAIAAAFPVQVYQPRA